MCFYQNNAELESSEQLRQAKPSTMDLPRTDSDRGKSNLTLCVFDVPSLAPPTSSPEHLGHFEMGARKVRSLFWGKSWAGAPFRNRTRKMSNSVLEELFGGSAISKSNKRSADPSFRGSIWRERHFEIEPDSFEISGNRFSEEVSSESVVSKWPTRLAFKIFNS